jgi:hypothetical protein
MGAVAGFFFMLLVSGAVILVLLIRKNGKFHDECIILEVSILRNT